VPQVQPKERLLLFSGGLDSTALAVLLSPEQALTIDYGQVSAAGEIRAAAAISTELGIAHHVLRCDCSGVGSGLLAGRDPDPAAPVVEWWPFRNQLLLTLAGAWALPHGCQELIVGSVRGDDAHADGTAAFYDRADDLISTQEGNLRVTAPALSKTSESLLREAHVPKGLLGFTHSCHCSEWACGLCPGCIKRTQILEEVGH
jgi:7-cyano-7-deazaguanine synthase